MRQPIQTLLYLTNNQNGDFEYLLLHRTAHRGGFWQGVTGGVEKGETVLQTAQRELWEETQLMASFIEQLNYSYSFAVGEKWRHLYATGVEEIVEYVCVAIVDGQPQPIIDANEHDQWQWCSFAQALALLTWPENKQALIYCHNYLTQRSQRS